MIGRYRGGVLPAVGERDDTADATLIEATDKLAARLDEAYRKVELQSCAQLPVEVARATNGFIDATAPFTLAKDPAKSARLDTVLNLSAQAIYRALVALLPVCPEKAAEGLRQLGVDPAGKTLDQLISATLPAGQQLGEGQPLFPESRGDHPSHIAGHRV